MKDLPDTSERRIAINTASRYVANAIGMLTSFILTPFLLSMIGPTLFGLKTLAGQALQFVGLASSAIGVSYNRYAATYYARKDYDAMNAVLSAGLLLSVISGGLFAVGTVIVTVYADTFFGLPPEIVGVARIVILITGLSTTFYILSGVWKAPVFIRQRFYLMAGAEVFSTVGAAVAVWLAFKYHSPSIIVWVLLDCGFRVGAEGLLLIPLCRRALPQMKVTFRHVAAGVRLREMIGFGSLTFIGQLGFLLYYATDSIIISNLRELGPPRIAYYNIAQRWDPLLHMVIVSFTSALTPLLTADFAVGNKLRLMNTLCRGTRYSLLVALYPCVLLVVFAAPFLHNWVGVDFAEVSGGVMQVIMAAFIVNVPSIMGYEFLIASGRLGKAVTALIVGGFVNIPLCVLLVKFAHLGLLGIALGSLIPLTLVNGLYVPALVSRDVGLPIRRYLSQGYARACLAAVPLIAAAVALRWFWEARNLFVVLAQFAACGLVYAASVWTLGLDKDDRTKIASALASVRGSILPRGGLGGPGAPSDGNP